MLKLFDLSGRVAIVTGAARGNGLAIAVGLLDAGARVILVDILGEKLQETIMRLENPNAIAVTSDVRTLADQEKIIGTALENYGKIDTLVNNAGISIGNNSSEDYRLEDWEKTYVTNLRAVFQLCQLVGKEMIRNKFGVIINVTSLGAELGFPENPAYVATKGGVRMLTRALARDWAKYNVRVINLCPGYMKTEMTAKSYRDEELHDERLSRMMIKRWGEPEDLAGPVVFLASNAARYITGTDIYVDGGWTANGL